MAINNSDSHQCYKHDESGDAEWWEKHISEQSHLHQSTRITCKDCNIQIENPDDYEGKLHGGALHPGYCEDCRKRNFGK